MSLIDELENDRRITGPRCRLGVLREYDRELFDEIEDAVEAGFTFAAIARRLRARDVDVSDQTLSRHFRQTCRCPS